MALWLLAALAGLAAAAPAVRRDTRCGPRVAPLALLRARRRGARRRAAARRAGRTQPARSLPSRARRVRELDARRPTAIAGARRSTRASRAGSGDTAALRRLARAPTTRAPPPTDHASRLRAVADRAAGTGHPVVVITDGELDDADALAALPRGSRGDRAAVPARARRSRSPRSRRRARSSPAIRPRSALTLAAGAAGAPAGQLELRLDGAAPRVAAAGRARPVRRAGGRAARDRRRARTAPRVLRAVVPRRGRRRAAQRHARHRRGRHARRRRRCSCRPRPTSTRAKRSRVLRGVTSLPDARLLPRRARRVAHRRCARARAEDEVRARRARRAARRSCTATRRSSARRASATRGALLLFAPPAGDEGEWFAAAAPASPLAPALSGAAVGQPAAARAWRRRCRAASGRGSIVREPGAARRAPRRARRLGDAAPHRGARRVRLLALAVPRRRSAPMPTARSSGRCSTGSPRAAAIARAVVPDAGVVRAGDAVALAARIGRRTASSRVDAARGAAHRRARIR